MNEQNDTAREWGNTIAEARAQARTEKAAAIADAMLYFITQHRWAMHHSGRSPDHEPYVVEARAELVRLIAEVLG